MSTPQGRPGAGLDQEEVRKVARWLLEVTFAASPQSALGRLGTVLNLKPGDPRITAVRRFLLRSLQELPDGVWLNGDTKLAVSNELKGAVTAAMERRGELTRYGLVSRKG